MSCCASLAITLLLIAPGALRGAQRGLAQDLVRKIVANELKAGDAPGHYMYRIHKQTPTGSQTREVIETRDWLIARLIRIDDKPLTLKQRQKEDGRLARLLNNRSRLQKEQQKQREDHERAKKLMRALPDAFIYEYAGTEDGKDSLVQLRFRPNPRFDAPSLKLEVLQGMEGEMVVDVTANRMQQIEAKLVREVKFGWGILAYLNHGGSFFMKQVNVGNGRWAIARLEMHFTGKVLVFKSLNIDSNPWAAFRRPTCGRVQQAESGHAGLRS